MATDKMVYVQNKHIAPITAKARDDKGKVKYVKVFQPEHTDVTTGRQVSTGFLALTEAEYKELCETSKTFRHYKDDLKLLIATDELPAYAKTPHEALADARAKERQLAAELDTAAQEITRLKAELLDEKEKYSKLESASTDEEKLQPLRDSLEKFETQTTKQNLLLTDILTGLGILAGNNKVTAKDVQQFSEKSSAGYKALLDELSEAKDLQ